MMDNGNGWLNVVMFDSRGHHERLPPLLPWACFAGWNLRRRRVAILVDVAAHVRVGFVRLAQSGIDGQLRPQLRMPFRQ